MIDERFVKQELCKHKSKEIGVSRLISKRLNIRGFEVMLWTIREFAWREESIKETIFSIFWRGKSTWGIYLYTSRSKELLRWIGGMIYGTICVVWWEGVMWWGYVRGRKYDLWHCCNFEFVPIIAAWACLCMAFTTFLQRKGVTRALICAFRALLNVWHSAALKKRQSRHLQSTRVFPKTHMPWFFWGVYCIKSPSPSSSPFPFWL
jgi:hypothetical protein